MFGAFPYGSRPFGSGPFVTAGQSLFTNNQSFFSPAVTSSYTIAPDTLVNSQTFFAPAVTAFNILQPPLFINQGNWNEHWIATEMTSWGTLNPSGTWTVIPQPTQAWETV